MALNKNDSFNPSDISWMDAGSDPQDRWFITKAMRFVFGAGKGVVTGVASKTWEKAADENLKHVDDINEEIESFRSAASESFSEFGEALSQFKHSAKEFGLSYTQALSPVLPGGIYRRLSRAFEEPESTEESPEERFENSLQSNLASVFSAQATISRDQHAASMKSAAADRSLQAKFHQQSIGISASINSSVEHIDSFLSNTYTKYLKKDLELKYRSYRVMNTTFEKVSMMAEAFDKEGFLRKFAGGTGDDQKKGGREVNTTGKYGQSVYKNIFSNILSTPTQFLQLGAALLGAMAQDPIQGIQGAAEIAGSLGAKPITNFFKKNFLSEKNQRRVEKAGEFGKDFLQLLSGDYNYFLKNKSGIINSLGQKLRGSDSRILSWLGNQIPQFERTSEVSNKVMEDPKGAAVFDNITRETIISVIPKHLERIGDLFDAFARSNNIETTDDDHKVFDFRSRGLVTRKERRVRNVETLYGSKEERQERYVTNVKTFSNLSAYLNSTEQQVQAADMIEQNKDALHMFIMKSARANLLLNKDAVIKFVKGDSLNYGEEDYIKEVFGGVNSPTGKNAARTIYYLICRRDPRTGEVRGIENMYVRQINDAITNASKDVDYTDEMRSVLEDLNMFDEEGYTYDNSGTATINEKDREREFLRDREGVGLEDLKGGEVDEDIQKQMDLRDKYYSKYNRKFKDAKTRANVSKLNRTLNSNVVTMFGGTVMNEMMDWVDLGNAAINEAIGGISESKILGKATDIVSKGKKNVIIGITFIRDKAKSSKTQDQPSDPVILRVRYKTPIGQEQDRDITDIKYTVGDANMCHVTDNDKPNMALADLVRQILSKFDKSKFDVEYSDRFLNFDYIGGMEGEDNESVLDAEMRRVRSSTASGESGSTGNISISGHEKKRIGNTAVDYLSSIDRNIVGIGKFLTTHLSAGLPGTAPGSEFEFLTQDEFDDRETAQREEAEREARTQREIQERVANMKDAMARQQEEEKAATQEDLSKRRTVSGRVSYNDWLQRVTDAKLPVKDLKEKYEDLVRQGKPYKHPQNEQERKANAQYEKQVASAYRAYQDALHRSIRVEQEFKNSDKFNTTTWINENEDYLTNAMSKEEIADAHRKMAGWLSRAKTPEEKEEIQARIVAFKQAIDAENWLEARRAADIDVNNIEDLSKKTAMRRDEHKSAKEKLKAAMDAEYQRELSEEEIAKIRKPYEEISQHTGTKYTEEQKIIANARLAQLQKAIEEKDWKGLRTSYHLNKAADTYNSYITAYEAKDWEKARSISETYDTKTSNGRQLFNDIMNKMSKVNKNGYVFRFTPETDFIIREELRRVMRMLRRTPQEDPKAAKLVLTALEDISKAFGTVKTTPAERTKAMAKVLDRIMTDQELRYYRTGESDVVDFASGEITEENPVDRDILENYDENGQRLTSEEKEEEENPQISSLRARFENFEKVGIKVPVVNKILDKLKWHKGKTVDEALSNLTRFADELEQTIPEDMLEELNSLKAMKDQKGNTKSEQVSINAAYDKALNSMMQQLRDVVLSPTKNQYGILTNQTNAGMLRETFSTVDALKKTAAQIDSEQKERIESAWKKYEDASFERLDLETDLANAKPEKKEEIQKKLDEVKQKEAEGLTELNSALAKDTNEKRKAEYTKKLEDHNKIISEHSGEKEPEKKEEKKSILGSITNKLIKAPLSQIEEMFFPETSKKINAKASSLKNKLKERWQKRKEKLDVKIETQPETGATGEEAKPSSSYADGSYNFMTKMAHLHSSNSPVMERVVLHADDKKTSLFGRISGGISSLFKNLKKISKIDESDKTFRTMSRLGFSKDTAAMAAFMAMIARKIDKSIIDAGDRAAAEVASRGDDYIPHWIPDSWKKKIKAYRRLAKGRLKKLGKNLARKAKVGAKVFGRKAMQGLRYVGGKAATIGKAVGSKALEYSKLVGSKALDLAQLVGSKSWSAAKLVGSKVAGFAGPRLQALNLIGQNAFQKVMPILGSPGVLASLGLGALGGGLGAFGSASSGAGSLSQAFSGLTGGAAGALAMTNPAIAAALAAAMGLNSMREGWNDKKTLKKTWGSETGLEDYKKGSTAAGNLINYLTFGLLNKTGGRKYVDKLMSYSGLGHLAGGVGGAIAGVGDMAKSIFRDDSSPFTPAEMKRAQAKLETDIKRGEPGAKQKLRDFEQAVKEENWYRARDISGVHVNAGSEFAKGLKRAAKGSLAVATLGLSSAIEMWTDKLMGNKDEPMTEEEIKKTLQKFAYLEKKFPEAKAKRLDFEEAVAGERWAIARKIAGMQENGLLSKKFGKVGAGFMLLGGPAGLAGGILFGNNKDEPMSDKEVETFRKKCTDLAKQGNQQAAELLDRFDRAIMNGNWAIARQLSGNETKSLFSKMLSVSKKINTYINPLSIYYYIGDNSTPMSEAEIKRFRDKMQYLKDKGDSLAASKLDKFEMAVIRNDWETARAVAKMPHKTMFRKGVEWSVDMLIGDWAGPGADKPMTQEEITKFRESLQRKIEMGNQAAQRVLDKFDDAVGRQNWKLARELSNTRNKGLLEKYMNSQKAAVKFLVKANAWMAGGWLFGSNQDSAMSQAEIDKFVQRMQKIDSPQSKDLLAKFQDAIADGDWRKAREISGVDDRSIANKITRWFISTDEFKSDNKQESTTEIAQRYRLISDRVKDALGKNNIDRAGKAMLAELRDEMQELDLLELDDEMLNEYEERLRKIDRSAGAIDKTDVSDYEKQRQAKMSLVKQRDALLMEIVAAQERCGIFQWSRRSDLKNLYKEVDSLTLDELDKDLLDSYDEELRTLDPKAVTTKGLTGEERKQLEKRLKRRNQLLGNIDESLDKISFLHPFKRSSLNTLKQEVESTLVEDLDDEMFESWDQELKSIDPEAHDSKQRTSEELKKLKELNRKRLILAGMIKESINDCGLLDFSKKADLKNLLKEVESTLEEELTDELLSDWEADYKSIDENALTVEDKEKIDKEHKELLRDKRKLLVKIKPKARRLSRSNSSEDKKTAAALNKLVDTLDAIDDDSIIREDIDDASEQYEDIMADSREVKEAAKASGGAKMSSGAREQAVSLDRNGNVVDVSEGSATDVSVKTKPGGSIIHTHPDGSPTSATDIAEAIKHGQTSVTTLRSSKVVGYSGGKADNAISETVRVKGDNKDDKSEAEMHSILSDIAGTMKKSVENTAGALTGNRDVLVGIYDRLGDVIDAVSEHNTTMNNKIVNSAVQSYALSKKYTQSQIQKPKKLTPVFKGSVLNISK